jgi:hypothetical protein
MIEPYTAVGLVPTFWGIRRREDIQKNLDHIEELTKAAFWLANLDIPVRLIAVPEGGLLGPATRPVRLVGREIRPHAAGLLAGGRYADRPPRRDDGHGGQLPGERAWAGTERRRGRLSRVAAGAVHAERFLRDLQPGARGAIVGKQIYSNGSTFVTGVVNVEALRHHRLNAQVTNWPKDIRAELAQIVYEKPIYPKNLHADAVPGRHADYKREVLDRQVRLMQERGIWKKPGGG